MDDEALERITKEEMKLLKEFLSSLQAERDAIISFSLEGLVREASRKEGIISKLSYLEKEKMVLMEGKQTKPLVSDHIKKLVKEVIRTMEGNKKLLSFSVHHVNGCIEQIIKPLCENEFGKAKEPLSFLLSKEV